MEYAELGWQEAVILGSAKREGILEALADGHRSAEEVAKELGASPRAVYALFSALVELGVLAEDRNRFRLLEEHRGPLLDRSHPDYAGGLVVHRFELIRKWVRMPEKLKTGSPIDDGPTQVPEGKETFIYSMRRLAKPGVRAVAELLPSRLPENPWHLRRGIHGRRGSGDRLRPTRGNPADEGTLGGSRYLCSWWELQRELARRSVRRSIPG
jgi:DNA-binding transcriptional ArsR family regulator